MGWPADERDEIPWEEMTPDEQEMADRFGFIPEGPPTGEESEPMSEEEARRIAEEARRIP